MYQRTSRGADLTGLADPNVDFTLADLDGDDVLDMLFAASGYLNVFKVLIGPEPAHKFRCVSLLTFSNLNRGGKLDIFRERPSHHFPSRRQ